MIQKGIKSANQIQFQDENGVPTVPVVNSQGAMKADLSSLPVGELGGVVVEIADGEKIDINKTVTTLLGGVVEATPIITDVTINKKVSQVSIANLSEEEEVVIDIGIKDKITIAPRIAIDLPINKELEKISIMKVGETPAKVQYLIKGVESV